jgi:hypothetical protein
MFIFHCYSSVYSLFFKPLIESIHLRYGLLNFSLQYLYLRHKLPNMHPQLFNLLLSKIRWVLRFPIPFLKCLKVTLKLSPLKREKIHLLSESNDILLYNFSFFSLAFEVLLQLTDLVYKLGLKFFETDSLTLNCIMFALP